MVLPSSDNLLIPINSKPKHLNSQPPTRSPKPQTLKPLQPELCHCAHTKEAHRITYTIVGVPYHI